MMSEKFPLNRIVAIASSVLLLVMALMPVIANFDWRSTAGIMAGIPAVAAIAYKWLHGWQLWEAPQAAIAAKEYAADPTDKKGYAHESENDVTKETFNG